MFPSREFPHGQDLEPKGRSDGWILSLAEVNPEDLERGPLHRSSFEMNVDGTCPWSLTKLFLNPNDEFRSRDGDLSGSCRRRFDRLAFHRGVVECIHGLLQCLRALGTLLISDNLKSFA